MAHLPVPGVSTLSLSSQRSEAGEKGEDRCFSACARAVTRGLQSCCAGNLVWLRALGYEQVLVIRSVTHLALWFSALVSLLFVTIWFSNVFTLRCTSTTYGHNGWRCVWEAVGIYVFVINFRNSIQMIAHFDDDRQRVLKQKWRALNALKQESQQVLERAKDTVNELRDKVIDSINDQIKGYVEEVFTIILPNLPAGSLQEPPPWCRGSPQLRHELLAALKGNLTEMQELVAAMFCDLEAEHPDLFRRRPPAFDFREKPRLPSWEALLSTIKGWDAFAVPEARIGAAGAPSAGGDPLSAGPSGAASPRSRARSRASTGGPSAFEAGAASPRRRLVDELVDEVAHPLRELLRTPEWLENLKVEILKGCVRRENRERFGLGRPPWGRGCSLCTPRMITTFCRFWCCCCACCCPSICGKGYQYSPPKRFTFGCFFWVQIYTKLQEQLIQGLFFSVAYCCLYAYIVGEMLEHFEEMCVNNRGNMLAVSKDCVLDIGRRCVAFMALICYIPALAICLYYVDRLDAVMETIETIWELGDVQRAVRTFNHQMEDVAEQKDQLKAIQDRVLKRAEFVAHFGSRVGAAVQQDEDTCTALLAEATRELVACLRRVADELRPASEWLHMPAEERKMRTVNALYFMEAVSSRSFRRGSCDQLSLPGRPGSHIELPATSFRGHDVEAAHLLDPEQGSGAAAALPHRSSSAGTFSDTGATFVAPST